MPLFAILSLFPEVIEPYSRASILGIAREKGLSDFLMVDFRDFARDRHRTVDGRPFGGGPGMVLKPEPIVDCVEWLEDRHGPFRKFCLCPTGRVFSQAMAEELTQEERILLLCGRYEGFDERVRAAIDLEDLSIGDFVLAGGELPALMVAEAVTRLIPGVLGDERSAQQDSFGTGSSGTGSSNTGSSSTELDPSSSPGNPKGSPKSESSRGGFDHPHYTRPRVFRGLEVPKVLFSGNHARIEAWRDKAARTKTHQRRPDLLGPD